MAPTPEHIHQQQELLSAYRRTLAHLLQQAATHGGETYAAPRVANGIHEARENIVRMKKYYAVGVWRPMIIWTKRRNTLRGACERSGTSRRSRPPRGRCI